MFVYQNTAGDICVTFTDNKPVEAPEYVISVDYEAKTISMVGGEDAPAADTKALEDQIDTLTTQLAEKDTTIAAQAATIKEKDQQIADLQAQAE